MKLIINGKSVQALPDQSLRDILGTLGLDTQSLNSRPLAAKIAGEVFTLNYIPLRKKDAQAERPSVRRAMAASNGQVRLLSYADPAPVTSAFV